MQDETKCFWCVFAINSSKINVKSASMAVKHEPNKGLGNFGLLYPVPSAFLEKLRT